MKKKIPYIVCGIIVLVAITAMIIFVLSGKDEVSTETVDLQGMWKVAVYVNNGTPTIIDNEYMQFDENSVRDYRDNAEAPYAESSYTLDEGLQLSLPDISRNYSVEKFTENYVRLYESQDVYMELIRYKNEDMSPLEVDTAKFEGKWNITYRNTANVYAGSYMVFENGTAAQYSAGSSEPVATSSFSWQNGNHLIVDGWAKEMVLYPVSDSTIIMVELATETGFIWEFERAD